ncbi:calpain-9-like isoform X2 [Clytia hemisphaerica]|uniref:calpain-9-like isoform X2 n=1 Tax=Clytia hemisphaerica TaxID=252671 RepID=UPI0034D69A71
MSTRKVYSSQGKSSYHLGGAHKDISANAKPSDSVPHNGVSYDDLKKHCLKQGVLFEDPDFPAVDQSMFFSRKPPRPFVWKRPKELVSDPKMFVGGASRFDITQGMLGDCWLLAAVAALCQYEGLLYQVVPPDQSFSSSDYCGIVRFRFWQYGRWEEVVVDDRLPTYNNKLVFLHSAQNNEFWSALLEKAYAKLCGSYESLKGGQTSEAMEDFTGGVTETFNTAKPPAKFYSLLMKAQERQSLMCCSIEAKPNEIEAKLNNGLIKGHAYTITSVQKAHVRGQEIELIRIRNPWGNEREWTGAWSDGSNEWKMLSDSEKKELGISYDDDGEFWMSFQDFCANYTKVEVCMLSPDSAGESDKKRWEMQINQGTWQQHVSAGGCRNFPDSFHLNPQYIVKLEDGDDDDDNCTIVIGLIQKGRRKQKRVGAQNLTIGFSVYKLDDDKDEYMQDDRLSKDFFLYHKSHARSHNFVNSREVTGRFSFEPGEYVIIPSTFKANEEGDFIMRMFSEKAHAGGSMDTKTQIEYKPKVLSQSEKDSFDSKFKPFFEKVAGNDGEIDAFELQAVLNSAFKKEMNGKSFSLEACRSMVAMVDRDRNGKLDYEEFRTMWTTVMRYKANFAQYDKDQSGDMSATELRDALAKLGFKLSTPVLSSLTLRYANKKGQVNIDDYLQICCRVKSSFESYLSYQGKSFSLDDYLQSSMYQ